MKLYNRVYTSNQAIFSQLHKICRKKLHLKRLIK